MVEQTLQNDHGEFIEYLDGKFSRVDEKFAVVDKRLDGVDRRFDAVDRRFDKLFDVFATKEDLHAVIENLPTKADFSALMNSVDAYARKADTYFQEMVMLSHKVDRLERWVLELADKLNLRLKA